MFTGIVEELGKVISRRGSRLRIAASTVLEGSDMGASIAVNGCCLTLVAKGTNEPGTNEPGTNERGTNEPGTSEPGTAWWEADVSDETYDRTNLSDIADGAVVNLERPMALGERLGGHIVLGHVDGVGTVVNPVPNLRVRIPRELMVYLVEKGSVTVDGISLTAFNFGDDTFDVAIIPHTSEVTTLGVRKAGDRVNIEMDVLAKHVERLLEAHISR